MQQRDPVRAVFADEGAVVLLARSDCWM